MFQTDYGGELRQNGNTLGARSAATIPMAMERPGMLRAYRPTTTACTTPGVYG
jgi:hypothetical protein